MVRKDNSVWLWLSAIVLSPLCWAHKMSMFSELSDLYSSTPGILCTSGPYWEARGHLWSARALSRLLRVCRHQRLLQGMYLKLWDPLQLYHLRWRLCLSHCGQNGEPLSISHLWLTIVNFNWPPFAARVYRLVRAIGFGCCRRLIIRY